MEVELYGFITVRKFPRLWQWSQESTVASQFSFGSPLGHQSGRFPVPAGFSIPRGVLA